MKKTVFANMNFYRKNYKTLLSRKTKYPCLVLITNTWDDYGYKTLFKLFLYHTALKRTEIGDIKIADRKLPASKDKETVTVIKESFTKLPKHQVSLGQSLEYYENLQKHLPDTYRSILTRLNDLTANADLRVKFKDLDVFKKSLIRSSEAEKIISEFLNQADAEPSGTFDFIYETTIPGADKNHIVDFSFSRQPSDNFRTVVLVGKNGTGKTQFLARLANSLCDSEEPGTFNPSRPLFTKVIAISFSMFDRFDIPRTSKKFSYKYIGFRQSGTILRTKTRDTRSRQSDKILGAETRDKRLRIAFNEVKKKGRTKEWFQFIGTVIDLEYLQSLLGTDYERHSDITKIKDFDLIISKRAELLSSGQSILIFIVTELLANIQSESIILYDEPETHLHPNAIAKLIKALNNILQRYNSYSVIATHSPIVVQETPSRNVRLFDRTGNTPIIKRLHDESFGENLSKITDSIFYHKQVKEGYKEYFDEQIKKKTIVEINEEFDGSLSMNALLYLNAIAPKKKRKK